MGEFFTWQMLMTYGGAVTATSLVTQALKGVGFIDKLPTRAFAYIVALVLLIAAAAFTGRLTLSCAALCVIDAAMVSLAANGAFAAIKAGTASATDAMKDKRQK